jgi:hypothetical protein
VVEARGEPGRWILNHRGGHPAREPAVAHLCRNLRPKQERSGDHENHRACDNEQAATTDDTQGFRAYTLLPGQRMGCYGQDKNHQEEDLDDQCVDLLRRKRIE